MSCTCIFHYFNCFPSHLFGCSLSQSCAWHFTYYFNVIVLICLISSLLISPPSLSLSLSLFLLSFSQGKLYLDPKVERTLSSASFSNEQDIRESTEAVKKLHHVMRQELSQGVHVMQAVTDQNANFAKLSFNFGTKLKVIPSDLRYTVHHHCVDHSLSLSPSLSPPPSLPLSLSDSSLYHILS